jgi:GNAT superfamily N-acetyltransferase
MIRVAQIHDAERLAALSGATFRETFGHLYPPEDLAAFLEQSHSAGRWRDFLADPSMQTWVAEEASQPIGYALAGPCQLPHPEVTGTCGELKRIYVVRSQQGTGVGRVLLDEALTWLKAQGRQAIWLGVYSGNDRARALYEKRGFRQVGEYAFVVRRTHDRELILRRST